MHGAQHSVAQCVGTHIHPHVCPQHCTPFLSSLCLSWRLVWHVAVDFVVSRRVPSPGLVTSRSLWFATVLVASFGAGSRDFKGQVSDERLASLLRTRVLRCLLFCHCVLVFVSSGVARGSRLPVHVDEFVACVLEVSPHFWCAADAHRR